MDNEIWKAVPACPGYEVSTHGKIRSFWRSAGRGKGHTIQEKPQRIIKPFILGPCRYLAIHIRNKIAKVHRLVLLAFVGPCPHGFEACHNDGDTSNNHISNLRWDTRKENCRDRSNHGKWSRAKIAPADVVKIRGLYDSGVYQKDISLIYGIAQNTVSQIVNKKIWQHI